jgi:beta-glucanase (GH16 family)
MSSREFTTIELTPDMQTAPAPANIDAFPYNKRVVEAKNKNMYCRGLLLGSLLLLVIGGATAAGVVLSKKHHDAHTPAPGPGPGPVPNAAGPYLDEPAPFDAKDGFEPMWWDEFDGYEIDRTKWYVQPDIIDYHGNNAQLQHYIDSPAAVDVGNDTLYIIADNPGEVQYDDVTRNYEQTYYTSGRINTNLTGGVWNPGMEANGSTWNTIRIEARLKAPRGPGVVGAFWMLPVDNNTCYAEIDLFETRTCDWTSLGSWYINDTATRGISKHGTVVRESYDKFCEEFVTYAIEWSKDYIAYYVGDGADPVFVTGQSTWAGQCDPNDLAAPYDRPFYIILNTAIGGYWSGTPQNDIFPSVMEVDYVRISGIRDV